jgi:hypothetical protein
VVGINLFVVAEELQDMIGKQYIKHHMGKKNRDHLIKQALWGVQLSMSKAVQQIKAISKIEEEYPE